MAVKSLKNLNSFSRGYIEGTSNKIDFSTTLTGIVATAGVVNSTTILFTTNLTINTGEHNEISPTVGQVLSGPGVVGIPKVIDSSTTADGFTSILVDIPQTIVPGVRLTVSSTNSGINEYELAGSTLSRSKEDVRLEHLVPGELLNYATDSNYNNNSSGGIKSFLDSYYQFMNTEEFLFRSIETFEDVVINNISTIRIPDPDQKNNKFFSLEGARASQFYDDADNVLTVGNNNVDFDINFYDINIYNADNIPDDYGLEFDSGKTVSITNLPSRLNNRKIKMITSIQNYVGANPSFRLNTIEDSLNINETEEEFLNMMQKEIAPAVDQNVKVNRRALYQRLIDFYKIRGSKDSIDTFFKLFFQDEEIAVEFPWDSTLKTSMGNWDNQSLVAANYTKQVNNVVAGDPASADLYGTSVSLDAVRNTLAVGAPGETDARGAVYIHTTTTDGVSWTQQAKIVSATAADSDDFGSVVSLSGDIVAISAPDDDAYTGGTAANSGSVEIWERVLTAAPSTFTWQHRATLLGAAASLNFGTDISLDGNTVAITVPGYDNGADKSNGAILVYKGLGTDWTLSQTIITPQQLSQTGVNGWGTKVVLRGDYLVASWTAYDNNKGSVSVFHKNDSTGLYNSVPEFVLSPSELSNDDLFGAAIDIDISGTTLPTIVVTATGSRTVYIYDRETINNVVQWVNVTSFKPTTGQTDDLFGTTAKIYNHNVLIGAPNSNGEGVTTIANSGLVYHFENGDQWVEKGVYKETQVAGNKFGSVIDISRNSKYYLLVGTPSSTNGHVVNFIRSSQSGKYLNNEGFVSDKQKIQDSEFYQKFSYVIKAGRNISQWENLYNKLVHPAGFKYFGEILIVIKAVRDSLGDGATETDGPNTTVLEKSVDVFGNEITVERPVNVYPALFSLRKTMSSMPGIQPGLTRDDIGLLIKMFASVFGPIGIARPNRSARLSITYLSPGGPGGGGIRSSGVSIVQSGAGYNIAPTVSSSEGSGAVIETEIDEFGEVINVVVKGGHPVGVQPADKPAAFSFDGTTDSNRDADTTKTGISTTTSGSGSNGVVSIVIAADKTITSVTGTTAGTGYKVGDVITVDGDALGSGAGDLLLTVTEVFSGTGYTANSALTVQPLSAVANSGVETAIGKVTDLTPITLTGTPLTANIFYKITDLGDATNDNFNTISTSAYDRTFWKVGDIFQAATTGSSLATTAKLVLAPIGLDFAPFANKKFLLPPEIIIAEPDAINSLGKPLTSNITAQANFILSNQILVNDTSMLVVGARYVISDKGNATDADFNILAVKQKTSNPIESVDTIAMTHASTGAHAGTYIVKDGDGFATGADGSGAEFEITINSISNVKVKVIKGGTGYAVNSSFTILGSAFTAGFNTTNDLTFDVAALGNWSVGDDFYAKEFGTGLSGATTAYVAPYNSGGTITGFKLTNAGLGYINNPIVNIRSNAIHEKRVPDVIPIRIVSNGNDVIEKDAITGLVTKTSIDRSNDYFGRKDYDVKAVLGTKKFNGEYYISQFASLTIENVGASTINKNNVNTTIQTVKDRNS